MKHLFLSAWMLLLAHVAAAQYKTNYNFRRITGKDGLTDASVRAIAQDKYGYIWIGTLGGLNRYDGYKVTSYTFNRKDSFSTPADFVQSIYCDDEGNLWLGYKSGLYYFDYSGNRFLLVEGTENISINDIKKGQDGRLYLFTNCGLARFKASSRQLTLMHTLNNDSLLHMPLSGGCISGDSVFAASTEGLLLYSLSGKPSQLLNPEKTKVTAIDKVVIDSSGTVWASRYNQGAVLYKLPKNKTQFEKIRALQYNYFGTFDIILDMYADNQNRLWLSTVWAGLVLLNGADNSFTSITHDYRLSNSIPENHVNVLFQDKQGFLWVGTEVAGVTYFQPDYNLFKVFIPEPYKKLRPHIWSRTITEDKQGNAWMGTGVGLAVYNKTAGIFRTIERNDKTKQTILHSNSIRSLLCDHEDNVWIGTSEGVNHFNNTTCRLTSLSVKDSLPEAFYWCLLEDSRHTIWAGCTAGLFYKKQEATKFSSLTTIPALQAYARFGVRSIFEDSRGMLWIGFNGKGLLKYNPVLEEATFWPGIDSETNRLGKLITSITEDKKGVIWISSYYGLASFNYRNNAFTLFADPAKMGSVQISSLLADEEDRLWMASPTGLLMLDRERKNFKRFSTSDGLPDIQFNDQSACLFKNGDFVYPTYDGFVAFNPLEYKERNHSANVFITSLLVHGKPLAQSLYTLETSAVSLAGSENFFSIELTAFNYNNPSETWYAYKLEGFDKDWMYTRNRVATYTNVPGGHYIFRYKASSDLNNWAQPEKYLDLFIATLFYKSIWFWVLCFSLIIAILLWLYFRRIHQQQKMHRLQSRTQLLEKEKTLVMYENLKQQLNPHFLFNSLTSLNGLIQLDPSKAGEFLESLSKTYRYILKNRGSELVSLFDEMRFVLTYAKLQQTRFEKGLHVITNVDETFYYRKIAPVTLQNLVENAIKHNIIDPEAPLTVEIYTEGDYVVIRNNLQKKKFVEASNKQGLENLISLYTFLTDRAVIVEEAADHFMIKIPLL